MSCIGNCLVLRDESRSAAVQQLQFDRGHHRRSGSGLGGTSDRGGSATEGPRFRDVTVVVVVVVVAVVIVAIVSRLLWQ